MREIVEHLESDDKGRHLGVVLFEVGNVNCTALEEPDDKLVTQHLRILIFSEKKLPITALPSYDQTCADDVSATSNTGS